MKSKYKIFRIKGKKFKVKMDYEPSLNTYEYHMYLRHLITPEQAIAAYFNISSEIYNDKYNRYEAYSEKYNITLYYTFLKDENILLITAFNQGGF